MNSYKKKLLIISSVLLFCVVVARVVALRYYFPSFPKLDEVASSSLEIREYESFEVPSGGDGLRGYAEQLRWEIAHPGLARLVEVHRKTKDLDTKLALMQLGYTFPPGTYIESFDDRHGFRICHHPKVLDHIEQYLDFERKVSVPSAEKP
jgi:hypothetical protein